jgi:hypothetical protein
MKGNIMKGYRTLAINGATVAGLAELQWAAGIDWTQYASPTAAMLILAGINMALRFATTTAVGKA